MFFDYECNQFYMMKADVEEEYVKFGVSKEQQELWRIEYVKHWLGELSIENLEPLHHLRSAGNPQEILPILFDLLNKGDSYAKFWIAHTILDFSTHSMITNRKGKEIALQAFKELIEGKIVISEKNKSKIDQGMMFFLKATTPEEYILNYSHQLYRQEKT